MNILSLNIFFNSLEDDPGTASFTPQIPQVEEGEAQRPEPWSTANQAQAQLYLWAAARYLTAHGFVLFPHLDSGEKNSIHLIRIN